MITASAATNHRTSTPSGIEAVLSPAASVPACARSVSAAPEAATPWAGSAPKLSRSRVLFLLGSALGRRWLLRCRWLFVAGSPLAVRCFAPGWPDRAPSFAATVSDREAPRQRSARRLAVRSEPGLLAVALASAVLLAVVRSPPRPLARWMRRVARRAADFPAAMMALKRAAA